MNGWRRTIDGLPNTTGYYLSYGEGVVSLAYYDVEADEWSPIGNAQGMKVTHWQDLPEGPE